MSVEENKAALRRYFDEVVNKGNLAVTDELFGPDYKLNHTDPVDLPNGPAGVRQFIIDTRIGFPDLQITVDDMVGNGDFVVTRWTMSGTQTGPFYSSPPSGKKAWWTGIVLSRFGNGKIQEETLNLDNLSLLMQLGVIPMPA